MGGCADLASSGAPEGGAEQTLILLPVLSPAVASLCLQPADCWRWPEGPSEYPVSVAKVPAGQQLGSRVFLLPEFSRFPLAPCGCLGNRRSAPKPFPQPANMCAIPKQYQLIGVFRQTAFDVGFFFSPLQIMNGTLLLFFKVFVSVNLGYTP